MMKRTKWFERKFALIEDNGLLPGIIERLEGTPVRLAAKVQNLGTTYMETGAAGDWGIKKEIGHLIDLEPLWLIRMKEIIAGKQNLISADLENTKTHEANHDQCEIAVLNDSFKKLRQQIIQLLRNVKPEDLEKAAKHPRLGTPMRLIDLAFFVAEHDDHHLAQITFLATK